MSNYFVRRWLTTIPTLFGGVTLIFLAVNLIPGDPVALMLENYFSGDAYEAIKIRLGLDQPLYVRYIRYLGDLLQGNLGTSFRTGRNVLMDILAQFPYTFSLALAALSLASLIGIVAGVVSATQRNTWPDQTIMVAALTAVSTPSFWYAILLMMFFSVRLRWFPTIGGGSLDEPLSFLKSLVLPAVAIGTRSAALIARLTRSALLDCLGQDYVQTARAKGLTERVVVFRHAFRNALLPVITIIGIDLGHMLGGTAIIEKVFSRPGVGKLLVDGVLARDYPQVQGAMIFFMVMILIANFLADVAYGIADPRIRYD
jgi:ABC-type dipeptide/oligopeptide/nickel transport system permease component